MAARSGKCFHARAGLPYILHSCCVLHKKNVYVNAIKSTSKCLFCQYWGHIPNRNTRHGNTCAVLSETTHEAWQYVRRAFLSIDARSRQQMYGCVCVLVLTMLTRLIARMTSKRNPILTSGRVEPTPHLVYFETSVSCWSVLPKMAAVDPAPLKPSMILIPRRCRSRRISRLQSHN